MLSIIIVNYNTFELTSKCLKSIFESKTDVNYEVIIVDNASSNHNPDDFLKNFPQIKLIRNTQNEGFGRANNRGMKAAKGDYFLLLNSDTELPDYNLKQTFDAIKNTNADVYSCAQRYTDGDIYYKFNTTYTFGHSLKNVIYFLPIFDIKRLRDALFNVYTLTVITKVQTVLGAYLVVKREVYETTNGFDPDFFLYAEETEWCYNRIRKNYQLYYDPSNEYLHKQGQSSRGLKMELQQFVSKSLGYYKRGYFIYFIYLILNYLVVLPMNVVFYLKSKKIYKDHYLQKIRLLQKAFPYLFGDILKYSNKFGARKEFLIVKELR